MNAVLKVDGLSHDFDGRPVFSGFDLHQPRGGHRLLLGPSGSGKTTLINMIAGLLTPDAGQIEVDGDAMTGLSASRRDDLRRRKIGIVFQTLRLVAALDVTANLLLAQRLAGAAQDRGAVANLLEQLGIAHRADARPREISQGEAQRAAIARALVGRPALLIADEPTSALDDANADVVARLLLDACDQNGSTLLVATHDKRLRRHLPEAASVKLMREAA